MYVVINYLDVHKHYLDVYKHKSKCKCAFSKIYLVDSIE